MTWPLASMVIVTVIVIGAVALRDGDISAVSSAIFTLLLALGLAELRDIKSQTNGSQTSLLEQNKALLAEIAQYRRDATRITDRALESNALAPQAQPDSNGGQAQTPPTGQTPPSPYPYP